MAEGAWCGCIHIVRMALMSACCRLSIYPIFIRCIRCAIIHVIQINQTQSRASISMFASFFFHSVKQGFVRFTLHLDSNVHVHIQFRKLIDLHVLSSVKLYKHPFLVWMLFSLHAWEIQSGTAVKEHYATATAHFASFSTLWNLCFCDAIACFIKQLFWYFHAIFGCKLKWELSKMNLFHGAIFWMIEHAVLYFNRGEMSWALMILNFQKMIFFASFFVMILK